METDQADPIDDADAGTATVAVPAPTARDRLALVAAALLAPLALFLVLQPERVGLVPNALDPFFYTGYAINFDDIFRSIGDTYYFVSRWTVYTPGRLATWVFGPEFGRLVLRWLVASGMVMSLWSLGRRWRWSPATRAVTAVVVLSTPVFARAFLTDYVEWVVVSAGFVLVTQALEQRVTAWRSAAIGTLAAVVAIANPLAVTVTFGPGAAYVLRPGLTWRRRCLHAAIGLASAAATVIGGLVYFRLVYDVPNVYAPTIDFVRNRSGQIDLLRSPRHTWMGAFLWIYIPPLLVTAAVVLRPLRELLLRSRAAAAAIVLMAVQYGIQVADQFVRNGNGLEISYYWSFVYPSVGVVLAVLVGAIAWSPRSAAAFVAVWVGVLAITSRYDLDLPGGRWFPLITIATLAVLVALATRLAPVAVGGLMIFALAMQVAAPDYDPSAYHPYNMNPLYEQVFFNPDSESAAEFDEALWLEDVLDTLPSDDDLFFFGFGKAERVFAVYGPHTTGHWFRPVGEGMLSEDSLTAISVGAVRQLVLVGPRAALDPVLAQIEQRLGRGTLELEQEHDGGLGFTIAVLRFPDPVTESVAWPAAFLPSATGVASGAARVADPATDPPSYIVMGPYVPLGDGGYRATVTYSSPAPPTVSVGTFDVASNGVPSVSTALAGTDGATVTVPLDFVATPADIWEFRVLMAGAAPVTVQSVASEPAASAG